MASKKHKNLYRYINFAGGLDYTTCGINVWPEDRTNKWSKVTCLNCWATKKITKRDTASGSGKIKFRVPK